MKDFLNKNLKLLIGGVLMTILIAVGIFAMTRTGQRQDIQNPLEDGKYKSQQSEKKEGEFLMLGNDAMSILKEAYNRREKSDYFLRYSLVENISEIDPIHSRYQIVEKKWNDLLRIDTYLSNNALTMSFIKNKQGSFGCNFGESRKEVPCYEMSQDEIGKDVGVLADFTLDSLKNLIEQKSFLATIVIEKEVLVDGQPRICDGFDYVLDSKNLTNEALSSVVSKILPNINQEELSAARDALTQLSYSGSLCFDRQFGVPLIADSVASVGDDKISSGQHAEYLSLGAEFSHALSAKSVIGKDEPDQYFKGKYRFEANTQDENFVYFGGKKGIFKIKDGVLVAQEAVPGGVTILDNFKGTIYASNSQGVYVKSGDSWKEDLKLSYAGDFEVFNDELYVATFYGIFVHRNGAWIQPNESFKNLEWTDKLVKNKKYFYATNKDGGLYVLEQGQWQLIQKVNPYKESQRLKVYDDRVFLSWKANLYELVGRDIQPLVMFDDVWGINDSIVFNGKVYTGGTKGVYLAGQGFVADDKKVGEVSDLIVFNGSLYIAGETAVYRINDKGDFSVVGDDKQTFNRPVALKEVDGVLYGYGKVGVYRLDGDRWTGVGVWSVSDIVAHNGHIYVVSGTEGLLDEIAVVANDPMETFALPSDAKIIKL